MLQGAAEETVVFTEGRSTSVFSVFSDSFQSDGRWKKKKIACTNIISANIMFMGFEDVKGDIRYMYYLFLQVLNF